MYYMTASLICQEANNKNPKKRPPGGDLFLNTVRVLYMKLFFLIRISGTLSRRRGSYRSAPADYGGERLSTAFAEQKVVVVLYQFLFEVFQHQIPDSARHLIENFVLQYLVGVHYFLLLLK
jgi:hypothetical protein